MKDYAILLSKVLGYIDLNDLDPKGSVSLPQLIRIISSRYKFEKFPKNLDESDPDKGIEFHQGMWGVVPITKFTIFTGILVVETRSGTAITKDFLDDVLAWVSSEYGTSYFPGIILRYAYISNVTFHSDAPVLQFNDAMNVLSKRLSSALTEIWQEPVHYEPVSLRLGHDPKTRMFPIATFALERWGQANFKDNKYYSEAPLPTENHIEMLDYFLQALSRG